MGKLVVNADDFGLSEKINDAILYAHKNGILTSTSIMANGKAFQHAVAKYMSSPTIDIGIHLTLVGEEPVLDPLTIPDLVTSKGMFYQHAKNFILKYLLGRIDERQIYKELEAQVVKVLDSGIAVSHIDSHQHLHMLPKILRAVISISKKYGIRFIRFPNEKINSSMLHELSHMPRLMQMLVLSSFCRIGRRLNFARTDRFFGFLYSGRLNRFNLISILYQLPITGVSEIMCHPGFEDSNSSYAHWDYHWQDELNALVDPNIKEFIVKNEIELISFRQL
jgi:hopanoid biosynthesis associated protein HpnK